MAQFPQSYVICIVSCTFIQLCAFFTEDQFMESLSVNECIWYPCVGFVSLLDLVT